MASFYKTENSKMTISEAISAGYSELQQLQEEMQEWADNLEAGNLGHTEKYNQVSEAADALSNVGDEPDELPEGEGDDQVEVVIMVPRRRGKGTGRATRRDNAISYLQSVVDNLEGLIGDIDEDPEDDDDGKKAEAATERKEALEAIKEQLEGTIGEAEGVEFPGMYG